MKRPVPNVRKAKAIHEKKQAERNATANKMKKRGDHSLGTLIESGCPGGVV